MLLIRPLFKCAHQSTKIALKTTTVQCLRSRFTWSSQPNKISPFKKAALTTVLSATCFVGFYRVHINYGAPQDPSAKKLQQTKSVSPNVSHSTPSSEINGKSGILPKKSC